MKDNCGLEFLGQSANDLKGGVHRINRPAQRYLLADLPVESAHGSDADETRGASDLELLNLCTRKVPIRKEPIYFRGVDRTVGELIGGVEKSPAEIFLGRNRRYVRNSGNLAFVRLRQRIGNACFVE